LFLAALGAALAAQSANRQKIRSLNDPAYSDLTTVLAEAGTVMLSPVLPCSDERLLAELDRVDPAKLSAAGAAAYDRILAAVAKEPRIADGPVSAQFGLRFEPRIDWRSDPGISWSELFCDRPPLLDLRAEATLGEVAYGFTSFSIAEDPNMIDAMPGSGFGLNLAEITAEPIGIDATFPDRAFGSLGGDFWSFVIGRDEQSLGSAGERNLTVSDAPEHYDFARLTLFSPRASYTALVIQLALPRDADGDASLASRGRYLYLHRLDFLFGGRLSLGLTEATLVGDAPLELRYLNPMMIFHGYEPWSEYPILGWGNGSGSEFGFEVNYNPWKYFSLYAQYQMNALSDPLKTIFWPSAVSEIPDGWGALAGASARVPLGGGHIVADAQAVYTTPYDYILTSPKLPETAGQSTPGYYAPSPASYIYDRPSHSNYPGATGRSRSWIGFSEGPDTILASLSVGYAEGGRWAASIDSSWKAQGENGLDTLNDWNTNSGSGIALKRTPSGTPEYTFRAGASASFGGPPVGFGARGAMARLSFDAQAHWSGIWNSGHEEGSFLQGWEFGIGAALELM
ncbi:MAG: hypothetical protein Q8M76_18340, partial [Spirochaetaceae bacterium]|nr:hypothetical protein [Spirochaetaceae bacterium]